MKHLSLIKNKGGAMDAKVIRSITTLLGEAAQFTGLDESERARLAQFTRELTLQRGEILFHRGDPCTGIHLLVSGQIKLAVVSSVGKEKIIELAGPGHLIGADTVFSTKGYGVFAEALSECHVLHIAKAGLRNELEGVPAVFQALLGTLAERSQQLVGEVEAYSLNTGTERVVGFLLNEVEGIGPRGDEAVLHLPVHKGVIASLLNLTQEHFSRILHELQVSGLVKVDGRFISIPSISRMRAEISFSPRFAPS